MMLLEVVVKIRLCTLIKNFFSSYEEDERVKKKLLCEAISKFDMNDKYYNTQNLNLALLVSFLII